MEYYKIVTLGCKVNTYESASMAIQLEKLNYKQASDNDTPSIIIINTCSVTSTADAKSRQMINREHKAYPNAVIAVVGCYSQVDSKTVAAINGVNIVIGTKNRSKIGEYVTTFLKEGKQIVDIENSLTNHVFEKIDVTTYNENTRAFLKIQDGCNNFCSYCLIPYARGPVRSRDKDDVIEEAKTLVNNGFKEIVLTGIHTAGYGQDFENYTFTDLLKDLIKEVPDLKRIRISSIEESELTDEFIELLANNPVIVPHLHMPLQSGCDTVLKRMNRKYNTDSFYKTMEKIRKAVPHIAITTDVIVGFPGESEEEFKITEEFIKKANFAALHVFPYSRRSGTVADRMPNQIDNSIKKDRARRLINLSEQLARRYAVECEEQVYEVLFETCDEETHTIVGHAPNYLKIEVDGDSSYLNKIYKVKLIQAGFPVNKGEIVGE